MSITALEQHPYLDPATVRDVQELAAVADRTDGTHPLSEHVRLALRRSGMSPAVHLLARTADGALAGYAQLDPAAGAAELVVHPSYRRRGVGRELATALLAAAGGPTSPGGEAARNAAGFRDTARILPFAAIGQPDGASAVPGPSAADAAQDGVGTGLRIWAHGDHPAAGALAVDLGFRRDRVLWQLGRHLADPLPAPDLPAGVAIRAFDPGADGPAWLAVNSRAFADHPEQGRWTTDDLLVRVAEPWFDAAGFLLAVREPDGELLGFHWTKVHGTGTGRIGEVYVLGVDPDAHSRGLGRALTLAGLRHLRERGLPRAMLYVDESNTAAARLYARLGFVRRSADVNYRHAAEPTAVPDDDFAERGGRADPPAPVVSGPDGPGL